MWLEILGSLALWLKDGKDTVMFMFREEYHVLGSTLDFQCGILYENEMIMVLDWRNLTVNASGWTAPLGGVRILSSGKC